MNFSRRFFLVSGIVLIVLGIVIFAYIIMTQYLHCVDMWQREKMWYHDSALKYFFDVSNGAIIIAFLLGSIPASIGVLLLKKL